MKDNRRPVFLFADCDLLCKNISHEHILKSSIESLNKSDLCAACIDFSNDEHDDFFELFTYAMEQFSITNIMHITQKFSGAERQFLKNANLILLSGGEVDTSWKIIKETKMDKIIRDGYKNGAILVGVSAGAIQLGRIGWSIKEGNSYQFFECLNLAPYLVHIHQEENQWRVLKDIISNYYPGEHGLGIPGKGGLVCYPNHSIQSIKKTAFEIQNVDGKLWENYIFPANGEE